MPVKSEAQRKAMYAALSGHSTLGIPKSVAEKFVGKGHDEETPAKDMSKFDWRAIRDGLRALFKFVDEEEREPEHAGDDQERDEKGQFKAVTGSVGGQRHIETKPGSGKYVPLGKVSVHKYEKGSEPHLHNIVHHTDNEKQADKTASRLWEKTGVPHFVRHTQYLNRPNGSKDSALDEASKGFASSVIFIEPAGHILFAKRSPTEENWPGTWSLPGGNADDGEGAADCAAREAKDETGYDCAADDLREVETKDTPYGYKHTTFACPVGERFDAKLNGEHSEFAWAPWDEPPQPLHPGVKATLDDLGSKLGEDQANLTTEKTGMIRTGVKTGEILPYTTEVLEEAGMLKGASVHPKDTENVISGAKLARPRMDSCLASDSTYPVKVLVADEWKYSRPLLEAAARKAQVRGRMDIARRARAILAGDENIIVSRDAEQKRDEHGQFAAAEGYRENAHNQEGQPWEWAKKVAEHKGGVEHIANIRHAGEPKEFIASRTFRKPGITGAKKVVGKYPSFKAAHEAVVKEVNSLPGAKDETDQPPRSNAAPPPLSTARKPPVPKIRERETAGDSMLVMAMDWCASVGISHIPTFQVMAFDRNSVRQYDTDGHLHVAESNISRACVSPYNGAEIPDHKKLGLDPDKVYQLLRDPGELEKAAPTANGKPILWSHKPTEAEDHATDLVIGSTGDEAKYSHPWLKNSLHFWPAYASKAIENGNQRALSAGYRYTADMTPGTFDGERYDGIMRGIKINHIALVQEGRVPGAIVGDSIR